MPALFIYLIKVNVALIVFCLGYYLVLRHLTFYTLNRIYLIVAIVFSSVYPQINISNYLNQHQQIARPVQVVVVNWQQPVQQVAAIPNYWYWLQVLFWLGACALVIRLVMQLTSLYRMHQQSKPLRHGKYDIRVIQGDVNPFSFWRNIYVNPDKHDTRELNAILEHEQVHVNQWHTLDILLAELSTICYWFNPGVWLIKKAVKENIEFITDNKIIKQGMDSKAYQYSLINVNFGARNNAMVNNFNISTIKKRIIMMNAKKSAPVNITRYLLLVPAAMLLLLVFSVSKAELKHSMVKNGNVVLNALNSAAYNMGLSNSKNNAPAHRKNNELKKETLLTDSLPKKAAKIDTGKKLTVKVIRKDGQEPEYYINGKKVTEEEIKKTAPGTIATVDVHKESGTKRVYIVTSDKAANHKNIDTIILNNAGDDAITSGDKKIKTIIINRDSATTIHTGSNGSKIYTNSFTFTTKSGDTVVNGKPARITAITTISPTATGYSINKSQPKIVFDDYLLVVDGKEITHEQMKKLSAANIESITVLKDKTAIEKYGDKGKNGVVLVTTKKKM